MPLKIIRRLNIFHLMIALVSFFSHYCFVIQSFLLDHFVCMIIYLCHESSGKSFDGET